MVVYTYIFRKHSHIVVHELLSNHSGSKLSVRSYRVIESVACLFIN